METLSNRNRNRNTCFGHSLVQVRRMHVSIVFAPNETFVVIDLLHILIGQKHILPSFFIVSIIHKTLYFGIHEYVLYLHYLIIHISEISKLTRAPVGRKIMCGGKNRQYFFHPHLIFLANGALGGITFGNCIQFCSTHVFKP